MDKYMKKSEVIAYIRNEAKEAQSAFEELGGESGIIAEAFNDLANDFSQGAVPYTTAEETFAQIPSADVAQWISVKERLPKVETEVLVTCNRNGYRFVCPAIYEDGTVLTQDSIWNWYDLDGTYSEEDDDYFVPQGWWENRQFTPDDVYNNLVDCAVTDWMPLPKLPKKGDADNG